MNGRRYMILLIEEDLILAILLGKLTLVDFDLPDDATVVHIDPDFRYRGWALTIESASFEPVPFGNEMPRFPLLTMRSMNHVVRPRFSRGWERPSAWNE